MANWLGMMWAPGRRYLSGGVKEGEVKGRQMGRGRKIRCKVV